jgi:hypothetical protein
MSLKLVVKSILSKIHSHQKQLPDVIIFTLIRSGSTLLLEILNTDKNRKSVSEPLSLTPDNRKILKKYLNSDTIAERYIDLSSSEQEALFRYFADLSEGKTANSYYWSDLFSKSHAFKSAGSIFKTHKITYLFDDFLQHFQSAKGIYLLRHPIPVSLSRRRIKGDHYIEEYLKAQKIHAAVSSEAKQITDSILEKGSLQEKLILSWCFENFVFFDQLSKNRLPDNLYFISFEELVSEPETYIPKLCKKTGITFSEAMIDAVNRPSHGTVHSSKETIQQIQNKNNIQILQKWKKQISPGQEKSCLKILQAFGINYYAENVVLPTIKSNIFDNRKT